MKTPDYLSYERYKKRKETNPNRRIFIFAMTFFVTLLGFSIFAKLLSPDVDVSIGSDSEMEAKDTGLGVKHFIDERLKLIQMEDSSSRPETKITENRETSQTIKQENTITEENISIPSRHSSASDDEEPVMPAYSETTPPRPNTRPTTQSQSSTVKISKVYVGKYSTIDQARVAQDILIDSNLGVTPFIKNIGGTYTLQIGSFTSRAKADELVGELKRNGYPARISQE